MLLTTSLASREGDHWPAETDAVLSRASMDVILNPSFFFEDGRSIGTAISATFHSYDGEFYGESGRVATRQAVRRSAVRAYQAGRGREGEAIPASRTARMPVRKMPSNVPAPPIEATGAPRPPILSRLRRSAPISVPIEPPI